MTSTRPSFSDSFGDSLEDSHQETENETGAPQADENATKIEHQTGELLHQVLQETVERKEPLHAGSQAETLHQLIEEGQALVRSLAVKIRRSIPVRIDLDDLIAYGQIGLAEAARDYRPAESCKFTTFAYYRIRGAIYDGLSKMSWTSRAQYHRLREQQEEADQPTAANPSAGDSSHRYEPRPLVLQRAVAPIPIVKLASERSGQSGDSSSDAFSLADEATPPSTLASNREISLVLDKMVDSLPADAARLIRTIYFEGATMQEAAQRLGISKSWASRLHAKTLEQLARSLRRAGAD